MSIVQPFSESYQNLLYDESRMVGHAEYVAFPRDEAGIARAVRFCAERGVPLTAQGSRTGLAGGASPDGGLILNLSRMDSILGMRQDAQGRFFLRAQPGVTLAAIRKALLLKAADVSGWSAESREAFAGMKAGEWFFSPDPTEPTASIGGMASCNARGARSFLYGATRKHIHALRVTLADGRVAELTRGCEKARGRDFTIHTEDGGALSGRLPDFDTPLIKDAGYYIQPDMDLIDLFIGSQGALGIIAELELALMPAPKSLSGVTAFFPDDDAALRYVSAVKRFRPQPASIEFFNGDALALVEVNTDPDAPIFAYTDYGLAMDCGAFLREVL